MKYRTIVADPPWPYEQTKRGGYPWRKGLPSGENGRKILPYETMSVEEIAALPVETMAGPNAHLYIWTTQRFLWETPQIIEAWGFRVAKVLTWCKPPTGFTMGGHPFGIASEFVVFGWRGTLEINTRIPRDWFEWPRKGGHSAKPEAFLDLVEQVSAGPYLEMFARRNRLGWDTWGDEALGHVELS